LRAKMAPVMDAVKAARDEPVTPPPLGARDPRPLEQAIVGTWRSPILTIAFQADGSVSATMLGGMQRRGRWSVDRAGRLISDVMGHQDAAQAWVVGDELTITRMGPRSRSRATEESAGIVDGRPVAGRLAVAYDQTSACKRLRWQVIMIRSARLGRLFQSSHSL